MAAFILVIMRLAAVTFLGKKVSAVTIEGVKLFGDTNSYIDIKSTSLYSLRCSYRTGYDDPVLKVNWYKDGQLVYTWNEGDSVSTAYRVLSGRVITTSNNNNLQNINFNNMITLRLSGNYTCEVVSKKENVKSEPFHLVVLDIPSDDFVSNVSLMSKLPEEAAHTPKESSNCTLIWDFKTPAIYPRPNVTCGYYSYLYDDVTRSVPAGLTMSLLTNGSWQAGFDHIHVQVAEIPRETRLACSVRVPDTSYKKVSKFEDNFVIDHLIDSKGCPSMFLDPLYRMQFTIDGGEMNCRGDLVPNSSGEPLNIKFGCAPGDIAVFPNGTQMASWSTEMTCDPMDFVWRRRLENERVLRPVTDIEKEVPMCLQNPNGGNKIGSSFGTAAVFIISLIWHWLHS